MQIIPLEPNLARFYFNYNPVLIEKIKKIPGREFNNKDPLGAYWTVPARNLYGAVCNGIISPGHLFPNFIQTVPKNIFQDLAVEIKGDRLKVTGNQNLQLFLKSIYDLCSYEYTEEELQKVENTDTIDKILDLNIPGRGKIHPMFDNSVFGLPDENSDEFFNMKIEELFK